LFTAIGAFSVVLGLLFAIFPSVLPHQRVAVSIVVLVVSAAYALIGAWPRPVGQSFKSPKTAIRIVEGDLFEGKGNLVIGMTDTFDTEVPDIISERSVQGQFLKQVYSDDRDALDDDLNGALARYSTVREFAPGTRPRGKQTAYEVGTVATIRHDGMCYFCIAYTTMNERHEAQATVEGIWKGLNCLWEEVRAVSNGDPVSIGVIGGGQSRIEQEFPAQDSIRVIALSYMFASRHRKVNEGLNIVVRPQNVQDLDMLELQAFLKSLTLS
jgi:hypothetical protein